MTTSTASQALRDTDTPAFVVSMTKYWSAGSPSIQADTLAEMADAADAVKTEVLRRFDLIVEQGAYHISDLADDVRPRPVLVITPTSLVLLDAVLAHAADPDAADSVETIKRLRDGVDCAARLGRAVGVKVVEDDGYPFIDSIDSDTKRMLHHR